MLVADVRMSGGNFSLHLQYVEDNSDSAIGDEVNTATDLVLEWLQRGEDVGEEQEGEAAQEVRAALKARDIR